jgi:hypothetical protein
MNSKIIFLLAVTIFISLNSLKASEDENQISLIKVWINIDFSHFFLNKNFFILN